MSQSFDVFQAGAWADLGQHCFQPKPEMKIDGKLFLSTKVALRGGEVSLNRMPAGGGMPFFHRHQKNEEVYVFVGGSGEMQIDDTRFPVKEGTVVRVSPKADRIWRNVSSNDLYFLCIQYPETADAPQTIVDGVKSDRPVAW